MIKIFLSKIEIRKFDSVGPKLRTVKFCFPERTQKYTTTPRSSLLMFSSSLVIQEHLISLAEIIHSVNDLGNEIYEIYKKRLTL